MNPLKNNRQIIIIGAKLIFIIFLSLGIILLNKNLDLERVKKVHIEMEKKLGATEVNQQLYSYNAQTPIGKFIVTDYQYLWVLPELDKYFKYGQIQNLEPSSMIFNDESVGYLLCTPSNSKEVPVFIETRIKSGQYKEIFSCQEYRFIKIR